MDFVKFIAKGFYIVSAMFLCLGFLGVSMMKFIDYPDLVQSFEKYGLPHWFMYAVGVVEFLAAGLIFTQKYRTYGLGLILIIITGAIYFHVSFEEKSQLYGPLIVLLLLAINFSTSWFLNDINTSNTNS